VEDSLKSGQLPEKRWFELILSGSLFGGGPLRRRKKAKKGKVRMPKNQPLQDAVK
jgi:hypothetical protein